MISLKSYAFFLITTLISVTSFSAQALDVAYDGYFRSRGNFFYNLDLDRDQSPATRAYTDLRFRLNPTFYVSDKIRIKTSLNFIDGVLGDNPFRSQAYRNPATSHDLDVDPNETEATVGRSINTTSSYGGAYSTDGNVQSADLQPIQLRRAWAELDIPYGTLKVGRMPNDFGLGIFANGGDDPHQEVGSSRDRILFDTNFGSYYVRPGVGWLIENKLDQSKDDFYEYFFIFGRKSLNQDLAVYLSYNGQDEATASSGGLTGTETAYWAFDFYAQNQFGKLNTLAEVVLYTGTFQGSSLLAVNGVLRTDWRPSRFSLLSELGYSSGSSATDIIEGDIKSFAFSRDYNVALIVFEEALPGGKTLHTTTGAADNVPTSPHSGAVSNTIYGRVKLGYDAADFFQPYLNVIVPFAATADASEAGGSWYGIEYDIMTVWPVNRYFEFNFDFGHFIPADYYDRVSASHSALLVRAGVLAKF